MDTLDVKVQSFKKLYRLKHLPTSGSEALKLFKEFRDSIPALFQPSPQLLQLSIGLENEAMHSNKHWKQHFMDLTTGLRIRYLAWPHASDDVVILLHDTARCSDTMIDLGNKLYERGYSMFALDFRGHGGSQTSSSQLYTANHLAEDVKAFIVAKDLYIKPVVLVGCGIGGIVSMTLASMAPMLIGAVACLDFALPPNIEGIAHSEGKNDSCLLLPQWSFWCGQGATFDSVASCAALLLHSLDGEEVIGSKDTQREQGETAAYTRSELNAAKDALPMLRKKPMQYVDDFPYYELKVDPKFFFTFDIKTFIGKVKALKCHVLILHGQRSGFVTARDADYFSSLICSRGSPQPVITNEIPGVEHCLLPDAVDEVYNSLVSFLEGPAIDSLADGTEASNFRTRRPEILGIRPLPQYNSIEEAQRALGPHKIPTMDAIREELRKLRLEEGGVSSDEDNDVRSNTALSQNPSDYFGFIG